MGIGRRIRDRRAELKMSRTELAEKIGVSKQTDMSWNGLIRIRKS